MRIAPKPKPGHEVTLDDLLKGSGQIDLTRTDFSVTFLNQTTVITGVRMRGRACTVEILNQPLPFETNRINFLNKAFGSFSKQEYRPASSEEIFSIFNIVHRHSENQGEENLNQAQQAQACIDYFRKFLELAGPIYTFTSIRINPSGYGDIVKHLPETNYKKELRGKISGPDGLIKYNSTDALEACRMLFDEPDVLKVNQVFSTITGQDLAISRVRAPKKNPIETLAIIGKEYCSAGGTAYKSELGFHSMGIRVTEVRQ